jgi:hypothetical protein
MLSIGYVINAFVAWHWFGEALAACRNCWASASSSSAYFWWQGHEPSTFLPFTRPSIDEETIAAVADVLRSGWITSGPRCRPSRPPSPTIAAAARCAPSIPARPPWKWRCAAGESRRRRHGDHHPLTWVATANVILEVGATPVFRRRRPGDPQHRP